MLVWFLPLFLVFLFIGLPVFFGMLAAPGIMLVLNGQERDLALLYRNCLLYTSPSPRDRQKSRMPSSA